MEYLLEMWPLLLGMVALAGLLFWWMWRSERTKDREHAEALAAAAAGVGGTVTGGEGVHAWSADLRGPMAHEVGGLINRLGTVSRPRFTTALDFQRGRWHVRVTEASMKKATSTSSAKFYEHRIEVATARLTPLKMSRRVHMNPLGRPLSERSKRALEKGWVSNIPMTAAREEAEWLRVTLPPDLDHEFIVFTSDLATAPRVLNPQAAEWLLAQTRSLGFPYGTFLSLTFESGFVYLTQSGRIDPSALLPVADTILGLLDRVPGATPRHPATAA